jgi:hypothetical protein
LAEEARLQAEAEAKALAEEEARSKVPPPMERDATWRTHVSFA